MARSHQIAAIPIRRTTAGSVEVLLVTSRETKRWVIPKGWPWPRVPPGEAAAGEAWEEAGVRGKVSKRAIGSFAYQKRKGDELIPLRVDVYVLEVTKEVKSWPEASQRERRWFAASEAASLVEEPELQEILGSLEQRLADG